MNAPSSPRGDDASHRVSEMLPPLSERRDVRKAVILAAGRGKRMGRLTKDRPKAALEVGGHALLDWQIEALRAAGITEIAVVTGHAAEALAGRDVTYIHNPDWMKGTQVDTLLAAAAWIGDEPVIVSYSDILYHPCAPLALLERPGEVVVAYDADHRWLWKQRFGNWLRDSETFKLGPGQVLTEIGAKARNVDDLDGQFIGLMLFTRQGLEALSREFVAANHVIQRKVDFTALLGRLIESGVRIDTAATGLPWMEIDSLRDLSLAEQMSREDKVNGRKKLLYFTSFDKTPRASGVPLRSAPTQLGTPTTISNVICIQNWGRSGSAFVQSLLDNHPQIVSTPNLYSRIFYEAWAQRISLAPDEEKIGIFLEAIRQWWDCALVDTAAGLHCLGDLHDKVAGVDRSSLEEHLRTILDGKPITRRSLFEAGHLAYAIARGQNLSDDHLRILFPIHGEPRSVAAAILEDFPAAQFLHTLRDPSTNFRSSANYVCANRLEERAEPFSASLGFLFGRIGTRYGRTYTTFGDRPYFQWLVELDLVRALRIEDLNASKVRTVGALAVWLGLSNTPSLQQSTFDGRIWWGGGGNSAAERTANSGHRPIHDAGWSHTGRRVAQALATMSPLLRAAYPEATVGNTPIRCGWLFGCLFLPLVGRFKAHPTFTQRLIACRQLRAIYPQQLRQQLDRRIIRERFRCSLIEYNAGLAQIRERLPWTKMFQSIEATLAISGDSPQWRTRAIYQLGDRHPNHQDKLDAFFLSDALHRQSVHENLIWATLLVLGGIVAIYIIFAQTLQHVSRAVLVRDRSPPMIII